MPTLYYVPNEQEGTENIPRSLLVDSSLLRSRLSGCHATLPQKERLLTFWKSVAWHPERQLRKTLK